MFIPDDLYAKIVQVMPVPCVDLLVVKPSGRVLLVKRRNEPCKGLWWFPGGRVHLGERRVDAACRKLREECGIAVDADIPVELLTADLILRNGRGDLRHGITTVFRIAVPESAEVTVDHQSTAAAWRAPAGWASEPLHPFVKGAMADRSEP